jgi:hypothetical protein
LKEFLNMKQIRLWLALALLGLAVHATAESVMVAAADSSPENKALANYICDGVADQVELMASLDLAPRNAIQMDGTPSSVAIYSNIRSRFSICWAPGSYNISAPVLVPNMADTVINAQGTYIEFAVTTSTVPAVEIKGMMRCRYNFGTIRSFSQHAALFVHPTDMPCQMSEVTWQGLNGYNNPRQGVGLWIEPTIGVSTCQFRGTDIWGFNGGIFVNDAPTGAKCDTNWFQVNYIRKCNNCINERGQNVDSNEWHVNVDASVANSEGIRTASKLGRWFITMGTYGYEHVNNALVVESGATKNIFEMSPPFADFNWVNASGNSTNRFVDYAVLPTH